MTVTATKTIRQVQLGRVVVRPGDVLVYEDRGGHVTVTGVAGEWVFCESASGRSVVVRRARTRR